MCILCGTSCLFEQKRKKAQPKIRAKLHIEVAKYEANSRSTFIQAQHALAISFELQILVKRSVNRYENANVK